VGFVVAGVTPERKRRRMTRAACVWATLNLLTFLSAGCSGEGSEAGARNLEDLFDERDPVQINDSLVWALTTRVSEEDARRLGPRLGQIPLSSLRGPAEHADHPAADGFAITTVSGERLAEEISPVPPTILETPYWPSIFRRVGARGRTGAFVATNLLYKVYRYGGDGRSQDSIWTPPPAWRQARQPEIGEFTPDRAQEWVQYLDSISVIKALAVVADSVLVVSVGGYEGMGASGDTDPGELMEVYVNGRPAGVDLQAPGKLVAYSRGSLFFLGRSNEPDEATLVEYEWRG